MKVFVCGLGLGHRE